MRIAVNLPTIPGTRELARTPREITLRGWMDGVRKSQYTKENSSEGFIFGYRAYCSYGRARDMSKS